MIPITAEYALRAIVHLSQQTSEPQNVGMIAERTLVPVHYLSKIMQMMVKRGLVKSHRGLKGGFTLNRDPKEISVLDVFDSVDFSPERIRSCPLGETTSPALCAVHQLIDNSLKALEDSFRSASIKELLDGKDGLEPLCTVTGEEVS